MPPSSNHRTPCPRCGEPVPEDYKFCPACAFRLRSDAEAPPTPLAPRERWLAVTAGLLLGLVILAIVALGFQLFARQSLPPERNEATVEDPLTVRGDLMRLFVQVPDGYAFFHWDSLSAVDQAEKPVLVWWNSAIMKYEVTRGMYAEFLTSTRENPERIPSYLRGLWRTNEAYIDRWWTQFTQHLDRSGSEPRERPEDLHAPLPEIYANILSVPPDWVTLGIYEDFDWALPDGTENLPVTNVSWYDALAFAEWAQAEVGLDDASDLRLPVEAEWMLAAHGNQPSYTYPWGMEILPYGCNNLNWWGSEKDARLLRVDFRYPEAPRYGRSPDGAWAMSGNAREWARNHGFVRTKEGLLLLEEGRYMARVLSGQEEDRFTEAPTLGGSYIEGIGDCTIDKTSRSYKEKIGRWPEVGFRLRMQGAPWGR